MKKFLDSNIKFKNKTVTERMQLLFHKNKELPLPTSISKHLNEFMPSEIKKLSSKNILYNTVRIGVTDTKFHKKVKNKSILKRIKLIPLKKMASAGDIAKYIFHLITENNYITNEVLNITGGE